MKLDETIVKLPGNAEQVFKGVRMDIYQWQQKNFDNTYTTFEIAKFKTSVHIIFITDENKILFQKEKQPRTKYYTNLPGGLVESNENLLNAAKRELLEETGITPKKIKLWRDYKIGQTVVFEKSYFIAKGIKEHNKQNLDSGENIKLYELEFDEFLQHVIRDEFIDSLFKLEVFKMLNNRKELEKFRQELFN